MIFNPAIHIITDILSMFLAYKYYAHLRRKKGDHVVEEKRFLVIVGAALGALIGSRLLASLGDINSFLHPASLVYYYANKTIVGAIIGGILGVEIFKKFLGVKTSTGDLFTFPLILGIIIGRVGCFLAGVSDGTAGNPSNLPWAIDQGDGILRHPTALYEIVFLAILFVILKIISKKINFKNGLLFRLFVSSYLIFRFFVEFIKPVEALYLGLSVIQMASILFALYYLITIFLYYNGRYGNSTN